MANLKIPSKYASTNMLLVDMGDGTFAIRMAVTSVAADGTSNTSLPAGRAPASASVPSVLSNEDFAALNKAPGIYRRATAVGTASDGVIVTGVTTAGTVTLTLSGGGSISVSVGLGSTVLGFGVTAAALGTAVGGTFQALFFV